MTITIEKNNIGELQWYLVMKNHDNVSVNNNQHKNFSRWILKKLQVEFKE